MKYLTFSEEVIYMAGKRTPYQYIYTIMNRAEEHLGTIQKCRVGAHMHWCFCPHGNMQFSAGCMDEIRACMKNPKKYLKENQ